MVHLQVFKKSVTAGILLYVMLLAAIFSLILQFYLHAQVLTAQNLRSEKDYQIAQLLATAVRKKYSNMEEKAAFQTSQAIIEFDKNKITVKLSDGNQYEF